MTSAGEFAVTTTGFVDGHSHLRSTALVDHGVRGTSLEEAILRMNAMTPVDVEDDVFVATSDLIRSGVTGVQAIVHSFLRPDEYLEMVAAIVRGTQRSGIRALLVLGATNQAEFFPLGCPPLAGMPSFTEPPHQQSPDDFIDIVTRALRDFSNQHFGIGPVGAQWCSDDLLEAIGHLAAIHGLRVHSHLLESSRQRSWAGEDPLDRLERHGLLGPTTSFAHGVWCNDADITRILDAGAQLVTCPHSNASLHSGTPDPTSWRRRGVPVAVGLDSIDPSATPWFTATRALSDEDALEALTRGGMIATGLATDADSVTWTSLRDGIVREVIIGGVARVQNGVLMNHDEVEDARKRIQLTLANDAPARGKRQAELDSVMPSYHAALDRFLA